MKVKPHAGGEGGSIAKNELSHNGLRGMHSFSKGPAITVEAAPDYAICTHLGNDKFLADDSNSDTKDGEPSASAGFLGRGKLMISCTSVGSEEANKGCTSTGGKDAIMT